MPRKLEGSKPKSCGGFVKSKWRAGVYRRFNARAHKAVTEVAETTTKVSQARWLDTVTLWTSD